MGVGSTPELIGGLLLPELPETDKGGVLGYWYPASLPSGHSVSSDRPCSVKIAVGFWHSGRGATTQPGPGSCGN